MLISIVIGTLTGILSGFGVGGGTLLMLYLTMVQNIAQPIAASTNLLYFVFCAPAALVSHIKNKLIDKKAWIYSTVSGVPVSLTAAMLASGIEISLLRRFFGVFLLFVGIKELFAKKT